MRADTHRTHLNLQPVSAVLHLRAVMPGASSRGGFGAGSTLCLAQAHSPPSDALSTRERWRFVLFCSCFAYSLLPRMSPGAKLLRPLSCPQPHPAAHTHHKTLGRSSCRLRVSTSPPSAVCLCPRRCRQPPRVASRDLHGPARSRSAAWALRLATHQGVPHLPRAPAAHPPSPPLCQRPAVSSWLLFPVSINGPGPWPGLPFP